MFLLSVENKNKFTNLIYITKKKPEIFIAQLHKNHSFCLTLLPSNIGIE